jgi:hypothetical protein
MMTAAPGNTPGASNRLQRHTIVKRIRHKKYTRVGSARVLSPPPPVITYYSGRSARSITYYKNGMGLLCTWRERAEDRKCVPINHAKCRGRLCIMFCMYAPGMFAIQLLIFQGGTPPDSLKKKSLLSSSSIVSPVVA